MAFWRVRGRSVSLLQGRCTSNGVRQKVLHTFGDFDELGQAVREQTWQTFCLALEQKFPTVAPDWKRLHQEAEQLLSGVQPTAEESSVWERQRKLRRALRYVAMELYRLDGRQPEDPDGVIGIGPDLIDCLRPGLRLVERMRGHSPESIDYLLPDMESTDALVDEARFDFQQQIGRGTRKFAIARRMNPFDPDIINSEGIAWLRRRRYPEAQERFELARKMGRLQIPDPDRVYDWGNLRVRPYLRATYNLALTHEHLTHYDLALQLFHECLERCPGDGLGARFHLGNLYHRLGRWESALHYYRATRDDGWVQQPNPHLDGACLLFQLHRLDESILWMLRGIAINPWIPKALRAKQRTPKKTFLSSDSWEWAQEYSADQRDLWSPEGRKMLHQVTLDFEVKPLLEGLLELQGKIKDEPDPLQRRHLLHLQEEAQNSLRSAEMASRVGGRLGQGASQR